MRLKILHKGTKRDEGTFNRESTDVLLDFGFCVKGSDFGVFAVRDCGYVGEGAEYYVLYSHLDRCVDDGFAIAIFNFYRVGTEIWSRHDEYGMDAC